jgi:hypothetical protein
LNERGASAASLISSPAWPKELAMLQGIFSFYSCLILGFLLLVAKLVHNNYGTGLRQIPGPRLAAITDFWRLVITWNRRPEQTYLHLHAQYGPVVRIGPRTISFSSPGAVPVIYALNAGYTKSAFYSVQQTIAKGRTLLTLFTSLDEKFHAKLRRAVSNAYAMSTLVQFEPLVDSTTMAFFDQIDSRFVDSDVVCDFGTWLQYYAFDVIGEMTYSKRLGFIDRGEDVGNIIKQLGKFLDYAAVVS